MEILQLSKVRNYINKYLDYTQPHYGFKDNAFYTCGNMWGKPHIRDWMVLGNKNSHISRLGKRQNFQNNSIWYHMYLVQKKNYNTHIDLLINLDVMMIWSKHDLIKKASFQAENLSFSLPNFHLWCVLC